MTPDEMVEQLARPFDIRDVKFLPKNVRGNRALAMPYISARSVMDRLDQVFGPANWTDDFQVLPDGSVQFFLSVRFDPAMDQWVKKTDVGSPSEQPDSGDRLKAAVSDGLKRCAVKLGCGRYLYSIPPIWADYDPQKKMFTVVPQLPNWALPPQQRPQTAPPHRQVPPAGPAPTQNKPGGGGQAADIRRNAPPPQNPKVQDNRPLTVRQQETYEGFLEALSKAESEAAVLAISGNIAAVVNADRNAMTPEQLQKLRDERADVLKFLQEQEAGGGSEDDGQDEYPG